MPRTTMPPLHPELSWGEAADGLADLHDAASLLLVMHAETDEHRLTLNLLAAGAHAAAELARQKEGR